MADYWKSQAKKFCDFCKCWIADNKPSVEFHEKGKRHKENVEKRLKEIGQKSRKEYKETLKVDCEMKKMEDAAMKAYLKDIEGDGDFTSQLIKQELREKKEKIAEEERRKEEDKEREEEEREREGKAEWLEAKSEEGHTYYWHVGTGEAVWEPPEGFVSMAQQAEREEAKSQAEAQAEEKQRKQEEKIQASKKEEEERQRGEEERASKAREKMRARAAKKEKKELRPFESVAMGPANKPDPYGGWKAVETAQPCPVDLELPKQSFAEISVPCIVDTQPKFRIREKTIGNLDGEGSGDFKKRKFNGSSRKNARQRLDDDQD